MLWDVVRRGTGNRARRELERNDLAGKTGTTNEGRDTWFVGFNANIVGASWVGFDDNRPLGGNEQGSSAALPMWIGFMREAFAGTPEQRPRRPRGIVEHRINPDDGPHRERRRAERDFREVRYRSLAGTRGGRLQRAARCSRSRRRSAAVRHTPIFFE